MFDIQILKSQINHQLDQFTAQSQDKEKIKFEAFSADL